MAHKIIIMRDKEEHSGGQDTVKLERHRALLEAAASGLGGVAPRFFKAVKASMAHNPKLPEDVREMGELQIQVLHTLSRGRHRASDLARHFNVTNPTMSRVIDSLVYKGYVKRLYDMDDRRCIYLELTDQGQEVGTQVQGSFYDALTRFLNPLSDEQLDDIVRASKHLETLVPEINFEAEQQPQGAMAHTHGTRYDAHRRPEAMQHAADRYAHRAIREAQHETRQQMREIQGEMHRKLQEKLRDRK